MRNVVLRALARVGLLRPAFRIYERLRALGDRSAPEHGDGLPLPPARLRMKVVGTTDAAAFLASGRLAAEWLRAAFERHHVRLEDGVRLLDFGCGCGRVARHWQPFASLELHGSDHDRDLVRWCSVHLPFGRFSVNRLEPPLEYADDSFEAVYALSVLTHLPEALQLPWIKELGRVLRPGGVVILTTLGSGYVDRMSSGERSAWDAGRLVVRWESVAGTNLCAAFHPRRYILDTFARELDVLEFVPQGAEGAGYQDLTVLRKPLEAASQAGARAPRR